MSFTLPDLPYSYDALEPHFDSQTMEIHHSRHHNLYITNLNNAIEGTNMENASIEEICKNHSENIAVRKLYDVQGESTLLEKTKSFQVLGLSLAETHKETLRNKTFKYQNRLIQAANTSIEEQQEIELRENQSFEAYLKEFLAKIS